MNQTSSKAKVCVVGGGPAGMMCGFLFARAGIDVVVIEKHGDFLRDFRGDTVHPSTLQLMYELGILDEFLRRPHQEMTELSGMIGDKQVRLADFSFLPTKCRFIAFMPQWEFLNFIAEKASLIPNFSLRMNTEAVDLIFDSERVTGVKTKTQNGEVDIDCNLVIAADGRGSVIRQAAGFEIEDVGAPMDVLWMHVTKKQSDPPQSIGRIVAGAMFIMLNREDYWQCGYVIPKGKLEELKSEGIEAFRERIVKIAPFTKDRVGALASWSDIKLLTVKVDYLKKWYRSGLLCIGDAAHAMSPIGGVGINLAIQDAVAAANILWQPLSNGGCTVSDLAKVQERRAYPTRMTQRLQVGIQNNIIKKILTATDTIKSPIALELFNIFPLLRAIPARIIGIGFRPEHIRSPERKTSKA